MADPPSAEFPGLSPGSPIIDGATVRELVARHEAEIERLMGQLARVERTAAEMEAEVRGHPAFGMLDPAERRRFEALGADEDRFDAAESVGGDVGSQEPRPRTTVDPRPRRRAGDVPAGALGSPGSGAARRQAKQGNSTERGERTWIASLVTSHWVWKAGIALTAIAILLIKFG